MPTASRSSAPPRDTRAKELSGQLAAIKHSFDNADGTKAIIGRLHEGHTICGTIDAPQDLAAGNFYLFLGAWTQHERHGWQFKFLSFARDVPRNSNGIVSYIARYCEGIGAATATKLVQAYEANTVRVLIEEPGRVIADGLLRQSVAEAASAALGRVADPRALDVHLELHCLFRDNHVPMRRKLIQKCIELWDRRAVDVIRADPFRLLVKRLPGIGFSAADKLYIALKHPPHRLKRQLLATWNTIQKNNNGDTWMLLSEGFRAVESNIGGAKVRPRRAVKLGVRGDWLRCRIDAEGSVWLAERGKAEAEQRLARHIDRLRRCAVPLWPREPLPGLTEHQQAELNKALTGPIALLTGSPGTGKTFAATRVIRAVAQAGLARLIHVCAPTGRAAVRITETMRSAGLPIDATTIHKALGQIADGGTWRFAHDEDSPLPYRLIVIDESSMLDTDLAASLFAALEDGTHILLIGDIGQLPPINHGAPLRDFLQAGLPAARLTEIKRNAGMIVQACAKVKDGEHFDSLRALDRWNPAVPEKNLIHLTCRGSEAIEEKLSAAYDWLTSQKKWDLVNDVQVICCRNETRKKLNCLLRDRLNTNPPGEHPTFRTGDKVICLRNDFFQSVAPGIAQERCFVANGDFGTVERFIGRRMFVGLSSPFRRVIVPLGRTEGQSEEEDLDDKDAFKKNGCRWDLAYAVTVHKYQGSENPVIIVVLDASMLLSSKEWLYTSLSRGKELCIVIGPGSEISRHINRSILPKRRTCLVELLRDYQQKENPS